MSAKSAQEETIRLAEIIRNDFVPDSVIFIAKGAYQIGLDLGNYFNVPVLEIFAERKTDKLKSIAAPILQLIPSKTKIFLRKYEIRRGIHKNNTNRNVYWGHIPAHIKNADFNNILLVDDSCDTGNTFIQCIQKIKIKYPNAKIKTAALNVFSSSSNKIKIDYFLNQDCIICGPWSKDSEENKTFIEHYNRRFKRGN